jgi:hypothetical protein
MLSFATWILFEWYHKTVFDCPLSLGPPVFGPPELVRVQIQKENYQ